MEGSEFDEATFFRALDEKPVRALLIGRRALIALGMPVLTADYDFWVHIDDIESLNEVALDFDLSANLTPAQARLRGRYVLENGEHLDILVARACSSREGGELRFEHAWERRIVVDAGGFRVHLPCIDDLIQTKKWAMRERDLIDIGYLEGLKRKGVGQ